MKLTSCIFLLNIMILYSHQFPKSFTDSLNQLQSKDKIDLLITDIPNIQEIHKYRDSLDLIGVVHPDFYGFEFKYDLSLNNIGTWEELQNGDRLWRYHVVCPNAFTVNIVLESVYIAPNSKLYFYNSENESLIGPLDSKINREHGVFSSHTIEGESIFIELYEPRQDFGINKFTISKIIYGFKEIEMPQFGLNNTLSQTLSSCNKDVNCVQGDEFCREKYSVAVIVSPSQVVDENDPPLWHHCSGVLMNNTSLDYKPYFLTAFHCLWSTNPDDLTETQILNQWSFKFGYMTQTCNSFSYRNTKVYSGADYISAWSATDFLLVEFQEQPISGETGFNDVFFSGWDNSTSTPTETASLHHALGDYMRIAVDEDAPVSVAASAGIVCGDPLPSGDWYWHTEWDVGETNNGSSGSPLYNENKHIVGQMSTFCNCSSPANDAEYGKISKSWNPSGMPSINHLKTWLDPINSGVTTLDGIKMPNLQYGWIFPNSSVTHYAAYTDMQIGSNSTSSYKVESGAELSLKAGKEIKISPCTQIRAGSEFHAYIQNPDCDDIVPLSDKLTDHNPNICSTYPKLVNEDQDFNSAYTGNTMLKVSPNPVTSISDISLTVGTADNVSLMLYDNLGNQRYSYLDNISLKSGTYNYKLDGNDLNSGMFVLVLKIDGIIVTEKVINLK